MGAMPPAEAEFAAGVGLRYVGPPVLLLQECVSKSRAVSKRRQDRSKWKQRCLSP